MLLYNGYPDRISIGIVIKYIKIAIFVGFTVVHHRKCSDFR